MEMRQPTVCLRVRLSLCVCVSVFTDICSSVNTREDFHLNHHNQSE